MLSNYKGDFPIFNKNPALVYLDSAATALKPRSVIDAMIKYYEEYSANVHRGIYALAERATEEYESARETVCKFLKAGSSREIIFLRNATEAINLTALSLARSILRRGDHVLISVAEHHSNLLPWYNLKEDYGIVVDVLGIEENGIFNQDLLIEKIHPRTKVASFSHLSHVLGTINPIKEMGLIFKKYGILFLVDAAQSAAHLPIDIGDLGCDFLTFSGHKLGGPTGIGVLYGREEILDKMPPFIKGGGMVNEINSEGVEWRELPWKFEAGTPNISGAIGLGAAINYIESVGFDSIRRTDEEICGEALRELGKISGVKIYGPDKLTERGGVVSFSVEDVHPHDLATILDRDGVAIRAGHHCAKPLMKRLGVEATARVSSWIYNTRADVDVLIKAIKKALEIFRKTS